MTKESGRAGFPLRMEPELKERLDRAAEEDGASLNNWILSALEEVLAYRDAKGAAERRKADIDRRLDMKFEAIVSVLAAEAKIDRASTAADRRVEFDELAEAAIEQRRDHAATYYHAKPRTSVEALCRDYLAVEEELDGVAVTGIDTSFEIQLDDADPDDGELDDADADGE